MNAESRSSDKHVLWVQIHGRFAILFNNGPKGYPHTRSILSDLTVLKIIKSVAGRKLPKVMREGSCTRNLMKHFMVI